MVRKLFSTIFTVILLPKINQSGIRPDDSTTNQLLYFVGEIHQALDSTECFEVRPVFLDISKAFGKVWHHGQIFKLKPNGISGNLLKLFQNYLSNRKQCVVLNDSYSDYSGIESGVPQGTLIDSHLTWNYHTDMLAAKLSRNIEMLTKIRHYVTNDTLRTIYFRIFSSIMMYGSQVWE